MWRRTDGLVNGGTRASRRSAAARVSVARMSQGYPPRVSAPHATAIVRAKDKAQTIERTLTLLREQTVRPEIIVVDSGSIDGTLEIARRYADRLIEIAPEEFSYGRALNIGARAASGDVHLAISAHCFPESRDWVERSVGHYRRADVAGTGGARFLPDGSPLTEVFYQSIDHARANPFWGFSNHASSWRASVWVEFPFDENIVACEDREWSWRVLSAGWTIAFEPELWVGMSHAWRSAREAYRRGLIFTPAIDSFAHWGPYSARDALREWWLDVPDTSRSKWLYRLDYRRNAGLLGKYRGLRSSRRASAGRAA
jgi:rhamnosyltransferase